jgi:F-type H+-transporting ATPase subunit b
MAGAATAAPAADDAHIEQGAHGEEPTSPFGGNFVNSVVTLIVFITVLVVLRKFAWGPILSGLQKREAFIRDSLAEAKKDRADAEKRLAEYTEQLNRAREEATAIVDEGRRDAEVVRQRIQSEARTEADAMIERAKREIGLARDAALKDLYDQTAEMATTVAGKVIRKQLSTEEHDRLLADSLDELGRLGPNGSA